MPNTIEDFMNRFGGKDTVDDREAAQYHDRFVSKHKDDRDFNNQAYHEGATEYLGKLPDQEFHDVARRAVAEAPPQERQGLLGSLLGALGGGAAGGAGIGGIAKMLGLGSSDPKQMNEDDAARVMNYARKERPEALQQTVAEKPWLLKAMGNPVVQGALAIAAAKLLNNRRGGAT